MKRMIAIALILVCMAGCSAKTEQPEQSTAPETTAAPETTVPETTVPETTMPLPKLVAGTIQGENIPGILCLLKQGDRVEVTGYADETHALVKMETGTGTVERELLRFAGDAAYESWTAYARYHTDMYRDYKLIGKPSETLKTNTKLTVLDELEDCYLVQAGQNMGYIAKAQASKYRIQSGAGGSAGTPGSQDGDNISLTAAEAIESRIVLLGNITKTGSAEIRADGGAVVLKSFHRGDTVQIVAQEGFAPELPGYTAIWEDDTYAYIPTPWISRDGDGEFTPWEGFAGNGCYLYDNYEMRGKPLKKINVNKSVTVLWQAGDVTLVRVGEDAGYVFTETIRTSRVPANGGGGGSSGGGSSSGGGGPQWTPPAM